MFAREGDVSLRRSTHKMVWSLFSHASNSEIGDRGGQPTGPDLLAADFFHVGLPEGHMISPFTC
jgi:hypothetical protein